MKTLCRWTLWLALILPAGLCRAEWDWTPLQIAFVSPAQVAPPDWDVYGLRLSLLYGENRSVAGFDVGLFSRTTKDLGGIEASVIWNDVNGGFKGIQVGGLGNSVYGDSTGIQVAGAFNRLEEGSQFLGAQIGAVNLTDECRGVQVGVVNHSVKMQGVQVGLINSCETLAGLQLGLVNINQAGPLLFCPILNVSF